MKEFTTLGESQPLHGRLIELLTDDQHGHNIMVVYTPPSPTWTHGGFKFPALQSHKWRYAVDDNRSIEVQFSADEC